MRYRVGRKVCLALAIILLAGGLVAGLVWVGYAHCTRQTFVNHLMENDWLEARLAIAFNKDLANCEYSSGLPLLVYAANDGYLDIVTFLLAHGADCCVCASDGRTGLHDAAANGDVNMVKLLVARCPQGIGLRDAGGDTPRDLALKAGHTECVRLLDEAKVLRERRADRVAQPPLQ